MSNVNFLQLSEYKPPVISEKGNKEWVAYGDDNDYFEYIIDRYRNSTTNNAVINNIIKLTYGKGLAAKDSRVKPNDYARMMTIFAKEDVKRVVSDCKIFGNAAFQVILNRNEVAKAKHIPVQLLRAEKCNDKGEIEAYWYSDNWEDLKNFPPKRIPAFGTKGDLQILYFGNYTVGQKYYSLPDYVGALPYSKLEEEVADYLINEVQNSFSPTTVVNFNNGVPDPEKRELMVNDVKRTLTGSKGKKVVVSFNSDETKKTTVDSIPLNDAPEHYSYLSEECQRKIMLGHNVTSPLLFGVASTNGFSSNADELRNSFILFENMVVKPLQELVIESIDRILMVNQISLNLYFATLQPLDKDGDLTNETNMSSVNCCLKTDKDLTDEEYAIIEEKLEGEFIDAEWELVDSRAVSDDNSSIEDWAKSKIKPKESLMQKLSGFITSKPSERSNLDRDIYKVRYSYSEIAGTNSSKSRKFCRNMMARTNNGVVYRKEDIDMASFRGVNNEFGHEGQNYSLWLYKGGVYCHHFWSENLYRLKTKTDGTPYVDKALSSSEEVESISGYNPNPTGLEKAQTATINQPNRGVYPV